MAFGNSVTADFLNQSYTLHYLILTLICDYVFLSLLLLLLLLLLRHRSLLLLGVLFQQEPFSVLFPIVGQSFLLS